VQLKSLPCGEEDMDDKPDDLEGMKSVSSITSGLETPEQIQLRKKDKDGTGTETPDSVRDVRKQPKQLYQVLEEKKAVVGGALFGTERTYVLPAAGSSATVATTAETEQEKKREAIKAKSSGQVNVTLNPEELEGLDPAAIKRKYDAQLEAEKKAAKDQEAAKRGDNDDEGNKEQRKTSKKRKNATTSSSSSSSSTSSNAKEQNKKKEKYKF